MAAGAAARALPLHPLTLACPPRSIILAGFSLWELLYSNAFVASGGSCGFPLPMSALTQGYVNLVAAAMFGFASIFFGALACCGVSCCTEVVATVVHVLAAVVILVDTAYMSTILFQQQRWPASSGAATEIPLSCDVGYYRAIAIYVMGLWLGVLVLPPFVALITHCLCGCAVDERLEEDVAKGRRGACCGRRGGGGGGDEAAAPLTGTAAAAAAGIGAGGAAPKLD